MRRTAFVSVGLLVAVVAVLVATSITMAAPAPAGAFKQDLFAGKTTDAGDVFVWNDATSLYVEIVLAGGWQMSESHVAAASAVGQIPQVNGNPPPGQFPFGDSYAPYETTDTFTIPLAGLDANPVVAVHAKLVHETSMWVYSEDGNTSVANTTAVPSGKVLPFASTDAWEAFGDPADPTPSTWDAGVGVGTFQFADWIWQSHRVQTPAADETVTFQRSFTVPGKVAPGSWMKVTTDDAYTASLNGTQVASDTWPNWSSVETASPFAPLQGANTLVFVATNSDESYGPSGTIDTNPGGLVYEARVNYYDRSESAWAGTLPFTGKNWATHFAYEPTFPTVRISNNPQVEEGGVLEYTVELSFAPWVTTTLTVQTDEAFSSLGDYTPQVTSLTFAPGDATETFSVQTTEDAVFEEPNTLGPGDIVWAHVTGGTNVSLPAAQDFVANLDLTDRWGLGFIVDDDPIVGDIRMGDGVAGGDPEQHLTFSLDESPDGGTYGYVNVDAGVDYSGAPHCVAYDFGTDTLRFAYQIPPGEGGLSGLWIVWRVTDGGSITAGFSVVADGAAATAACADSGFAPTNSYNVYSGSVNF